MVTDAGVEIVDGAPVSHFTHVCAGVKIGKVVSLGQNIFVGNKVTISDKRKIQNNGSVYDNVYLEGGVLCGPSAMFTNVYNPRSLIGCECEHRDVLVKKAEA